MSDPPGHFMLFCKLQKGGLTDAKRSQRDIEKQDENKKANDPGKKEDQ